MNYQEIEGLALCGEVWAQKLKAVHDAVNVQILADRQAKLDARPGIRVGDFVLDGDKVLRVAHHWGDSIQLSTGGSFYLTELGGCSMSGGLDPGIPVERFSATDERREGSVWFFSRNMSMAHNGYYTKAVFKVWRLTDDASTRD